MKNYKCNPKGFSGNKEQKEFQANINALKDELINVIDRANERGVDYHGIAWFMVQIATNMVATCANSKAIAHSVVLEAMQAGFEEYEKDVKHAELVSELKD